MRLAVIAIIVSSLLSWGSSASANETPQNAKQHYKKAETHYHVGEFEKALKHYLEALRLDRRPHFHFNVAQCYRNLKKLEKARFHYELYLSTWQSWRPDTTAPFTDEVKGHIVALGEAIAAKGVEKPSATSKPVQTEKATPATLPTPGEKNVPVRPRKKQQPSRLWLAVGVGGAVLAAGALGLGIGYNVKFNDTPINLPESSTQKAISITGYALAGAFAITSALGWYFHFRKPAKSEALSVNPRGFGVAFGPGQVSAAASFSF
jgi:tetratricopeptide (TPR) repeat protein